ncbi:MAG: Uma2 family endonuclease, partial [bacterium]|nr:Uma2 family endonuclease [bacterium]
MANLAPVAAPPRAPTIHYPETDGKPVGETDWHISALLTLLASLRLHFATDTSTYVGGNLLFYYRQGDPRKRRAPDVFVVKNVGKHKRRVFKLWEERAVPCTVFEITSESTKAEDTGTKYRLYQQLGVTEYVLFDPQGEYLTPPLRGYELVGGRYRPMSPAADGSLHSRQLDVILRPQEELLRVVDPVGGDPGPTTAEAVARLRREMARVQTEAERAEREARRADAAAER